MVAAQTAEMILDIGELAAQHRIGADRLTRYLGLLSERGEVGLAGFEGGGGETPTEAVLAEIGEKLGLIRGLTGDPPRRSDICARRPLAVAIRAAGSKVASVTSPTFDAHA
jgi:hypothetical protein